MKKEARHLYLKAIDSLILSIELFNRPNNCGRVHGVLIFLDHSFEMILKAAILQKGGKIREKRANETIGFSSCIRKAFSDASIKFLKEEDVLTLQTINGFRNAAQHYILEVSEQMFYSLTQSGLTLFRDITQRVFGINLRLELPIRVLPLSTTPPMEMQAMFLHEVDEVKKLIQPASRKNLEALEKLRALAIMENAIEGIETQPSEAQLKTLTKKLKEGSTWEQIFPGASTIKFTTNGYGISLDLRFTKSEDAIPFTSVPEGTPGAAVIAIKRVNELDYYSLSLSDISSKLGITSNKLLAVIKETKLQEDLKYFKVIRIKSSSFKRYSVVALDFLKNMLPQIDMDAVWEKHRYRVINR